MLRRLGVLTYWGAVAGGVFLLCRISAMALLAGGETLAGAWAGGTTIVIMFGPVGLFVVSTLVFCLYKLGYWLIKGEDGPALITEFWAALYAALYFVHLFILGKTSWQREKRIMHQAQVNREAERIRPYLQELDKEFPGV